MILQNVLFLEQKWGVEEQQIKATYSAKMDSNQLAKI
jgi:hypothetical protein